MGMIDREVKRGKRAKKQTISRKAVLPKTSNFTLKQAQDVLITATLPETEPIISVPEPKLETKSQPVRLRVPAYLEPITKNSLAVIIIMSVLLALAFALREMLAAQQSAYMDESTFVLTGRYLLEKNSVYAGALDWTYGSYLWSIIAALTYVVGGLTLLRTLQALLGTLMVAATIIAAVRLAPRRANNKLDWTTALIAGLLMAIFPTAIAVGRFATYDGLSGAAFMGGIALLIPAFKASGRRTELLAAAALVFIAFLAKYVVAIYIPFIFVYLLFSNRTRPTMLRVVGWFIAPVTLACIIYFLLFQKELTTLLTFSTTYTDLESNNPIQQYLIDQPEIWVLAVIAAFGWLFADKTGRIVAVGGVVILAIFQALSRADYDFWKHSIYAIFFLAPMAGLAIAALGRNIASALEGRWVESLAIAGATLFLLALGLSYSLEKSDQLVTFYPNLNPAMQAIQANSVNAKTVLTDDDALRLYLYPRISTDNVVDPFYINYQGLQGLAGYKAAITDRYFNLIVLDGGIGPLGTQLRQQLGNLIDQYYQPIYNTVENNNQTILIYKPRAGQINTGDNTANANVRTYQFYGEVQGWGGQPENGNLKTGLQVSVSQAQTYDQHSTLEFKVTPQISTVGVKQTMSVSKVVAWVYIETTGNSQLAVPVGIIGFDMAWKWHDDGFKQMVTPGQWVKLTWQLPQAGQYNEIGLKFPQGVQAAYVGQVQIWP